MFDTHKTRMIGLPCSEGTMTCRHQLLVPCYQLSSLGRRSFAVAGPIKRLGIRCRL